MKSNKVQEWNRARSRLKMVFQVKEITSCELKLGAECMGGEYLSFAHRHKRNWYNLNPHLLEDFNQVVLACANCHDQIERNAVLTEQKFIELRGEEKLDSSVIQDDDNKEDDDKQGLEEDIVEDSPHSGLRRTKPEKKDAKRISKKADWMKPHKCVNCKRQNNGLFICPYCNEKSI